MSFHRSLLFIAVALLGGMNPVWASTQDKLKKVEAQLNQQQQQQQTLEQKAQDAAESLNNLRQKLIEATQALQAKEQEESQLEDRLDGLTQDITAKTKALSLEKQKLNALITALIELSRQPPETLFLQTGLTVDHIHRSILFRTALPHIQEQTEAIIRDLVALHDLQAQVAGQQHLVVAAQENLRGQQHDLDQLIKARQGLLQRTEAQKQAITYQLVSLSNEAKDLRQLLDKVSPKHGSKQAPAPTHALLKAPVVGTLTHDFGVPDADGVISQGLTFAALSGSPVVAPEAGRVVFAGPFRGYGQILILQHEGGYHSFLAGFGRIDADMGQDVEAGEPLGVLPVKSNGRPELYFEWRHNNEPVDPHAQGMTRP